jgi:hypothetical protein
MSTLHQSVLGYYHTFISSRLLTNTDHTKDARLLLRWMLIFIHHALTGPFDPMAPGAASSLPPHVLDVSQLEEVFSVFWLCIFMDLGHLLDPFAYLDDSQPIDRPHHPSVQENLMDMNARGHARNLILWWSANYVFVDPETGVEVAGGDVYDRMLLQHCQVLVNYKHLAEQQGVQGEVIQCSADRFEHAVHAYLKSITHALSASHTPFPDTTSLAWAEPSYSVCLKISQGAIFKNG